MPKQIVCVRDTKVGKFSALGGKKMQLLKRHEN
jgi:hypothetical protein